jgi:hypothetical protein
MKNILAKFVALTHSQSYIDFITHAPLAAAIVLAHPGAWSFALAASIGLWKNMLLDLCFQPDWSEHAALQACIFYIVGASIGLGVSMW